MSNFKLGGHVSVNGHKGFVSEIVSENIIKVTFKDGTSEVVRRRGRPKRVEASTKVPAEALTKIIRVNGTIEYRLPNGKCHRADGPAVIWLDGMVEYWVDGKKHRTDGPAVICPYGYQAYYVNGKRHRTDGPARIWDDGTVEYWLEGREYTKEEFEALSA